MISTVSAVSIAAYMFSLLKFRGKWIQQQVAFLGVFLAGLTIIGQLDVLLPIYFVVSLLPFIGHIRRISVTTGLLIVYFSLYLLYGLIAQSITGTIITFVAKMWQLVVFFLVVESNITVEQDDYKRTITVAFLMECLLGVYLLINGTMVDRINGLVRLVSNSQPITGNLSTVILPLMCLYYSLNRGNSRRTRWLLWISIGMLVWIVLSGTRGYTLEFVGTLFLLFLDYFTNKSTSEATQRNRAIILFLLGGMAIALVFVVPGIMEKLSSVLRLRQDVGIRTFENDAIKEFIKESSLLNAGFGIGLGGTGGTNAVLRDALYNQFSLGMWNQRHYITSSGALFHSLYSNILLCLGVFGIVVTFLINIKMWKTISRICDDDLLLRRMLHMFQLSFLLMNYYRWSAVCGIAEMIVLALVLKYVECIKRYEQGKGGELVE